MKERMLILAIQIALACSVVIVAVGLVYLLLKHPTRLLVGLFIPAVIWGMYEPAKLLYDYFNKKR